MILFILFSILFFAEIRWSPRLDWIEEEEMLLLYYNYKNTRKYFVIWK
jgi:hypothetical protein